MYNVCSANCGYCRSGLCFLVCSIPCLCVCVFVCVCVCVCARARVHMGGMVRVLRKKSQPKAYLHAYALYTSNPMSCSHCSRSS